MALLQNGKALSGSLQTIPKDKEGIRIQDVEFRSGFGLGRTIAGD